MKIIGKSEVTAEQMAEYLIKRNTSAKSWALEYARLYLEEGNAEGIRGDGAWIQACKETGNFKFTGGTAVTFDQNNFCGLGVTKKGMKGHSFDTPRLGIRAQIQHLKGYATSIPLKNPCIDPRYKYINPKGKSPGFENLAGKWAVPGYDTKKASSLQDAMNKKIGYGFDIIAGIEEMKKIKVSGNILENNNSQTEVMNPMGITIKLLLANPSNYGGTRSASSIKYLIYHYTSNKTDKAVSNAKYFKNNVVKASAHYFVDEHEIYQSVDDLKNAYSVGGSKWTDCHSTGGGSMYGKITNSNSISIEMCSTNGIISEATMKNAIALGKMIMRKYNIPISNVYRHFDVNGKHCPGWTGWYGNDSSKWISFKNRISGSALQPSTPSTSTPSTSSKELYRIRKSWSSPSSQIGAYNSLDKAKAACKNGYYVFDSKGNIVYPTSSNNSSSSTSSTYQVKLLEDLNIRQTPNGKIVQVNGAKKGLIYTIVKSQGTWGFLKSGAGWISVSSKYVKRV